MLDVLREMLTSKKFLAAFSSSVAAMLIKLAGKYGVVLDPATANDLVMLILPPAIAYVLAQGAADHGKSAAEIHDITRREQLPARGEPPAQQ